MLARRVPVAGLLKPGLDPISQDGLSALKSPPLLLILLIFWISLPLGSQAQEIFSGASPAFPSLSAAPGARPVAMGESFTAVADDASALFFNPAGLAWLDQAQLSVMHVNYLGGALYETAAFATPFSNRFGFGLHVGFLNYGDFDRRNETGALLGDFTARDLSAGVGAGWEIAKGFSLGLRSAWISQSIDRNTRNGLWWDLGLLARPSKSFRIGVDLKNMGVAENGGAPPFETRWSAAWRWVEIKTLNAIWISAGAALVPHGGDRMNVGAELDHQQKIFFRAGWSPALADNGLGPLQGLSLGLGVRAHRLQVDYAFTLADKLGELHRVTLSYLFPGKHAADENLPLAIPARRKKTPAIEPGSPSTRLPVLPTPGEYPPPQPPVTAGVSPQASVTLTKEKPGKTNDESLVVLSFKVEDIELLDAKQCLTRGRELEKQGQYKEALKFCLAAVEKDPHLEGGWLEVGQLQIRMGLAAFEEALKQDPNNETLRRWLQNQRSR